MKLGVWTNGLEARLKVCVGSVATLEDVLTASIILSASWARSLIVITCMECRCGQKSNFSIYIIYIYIILIVIVHLKLSISNCPSQIVHLKLSILNCPSQIVHLKPVIHLHIVHNKLSISNCPTQIVHLKLSISNSPVHLKPVVHLHIVHNNLSSRISTVIFILDHVISGCQAPDMYMSGACGKNLYERLLNSNAIIVRYAVFVN